MEIIHHLFSICCNQDAARSPQYAGDIFPVCYRCAGLYFGMLSSYLFCHLKKNAMANAFGKHTGSWLILCILPLCVDGFANLTGAWFTPGNIRSLTGVLCGIVLPLFLSLIRNSSVNPQLLHKINGWYLVSPLLLSSFFLWMLLHQPSQFIFRCMAFIAATGMALFFASLVTTFFYLKTPVFSENKY